MASVIKNINICNFQGSFEPIFLRLVFHSLLDTIFENDVEMYGAQTTKSNNGRNSMFENDVEMYGAQTYSMIQR